MDAQPENQLSPAKISDRLFVRQLGYTRSLVTFLIRRQALPEKPPDLLANLAALGRMRYSPRGRAASEEEWRKLYAISHGLASELPLEIATAFSIWRLRTFFGLFPFIFLIMGIAALEATYLEGYAVGGWYYFIGLAAVLSWTCALGGLGTSAFFGTSLLAQLASATANDQAKLKEITDDTYLRTRLMIGICLRLYSACRSVTCHLILQVQVFLRMSFGMRNYLRRCCIFWLRFCWASARLSFCLFLND